MAPRPVDRQRVLPRSPQRGDVQGRVVSQRPLACVVPKPGKAVTKDEILSHLRGKFAAWWLPDDVVFIDEVPKTSVGKFDKKVLRERFAAHLLKQAVP